AKAAVIRERGRALPGARETLEVLSRTEGVVQSLLTGNLRPNALLKLASFGLDGYLDFESGGFGSDHPHRPHLVGVARAKAGGPAGAALPGPGRPAPPRPPCGSATPPWTSPPAAPVGPGWSRSPPAPSGPTSSAPPRPTPPSRHRVTPRQRCCASWR